MKCLVFSLLIIGPEVRARPGEPINSRLNLNVCVGLHAFPIMRKLFYPER